MATLNLGRIKPVFRGAYSGSTAYVVDDIVTSGGSSYICIQAHGAGTQAVTQTAYWSVLASTGTDVGTTITTQGDILYRDGSGLQRLAKGTAGQALKMNSGANAPEWGTISSDYVKVYDQALSGATTYTISNVFSTTYDSYAIQMQNYSSHSDGGSIYMRVVDSGGVKSGSEYYYGSNQITRSSGSTSHGTNGGWGQSEWWISNSVTNAINGGYAWINIGNVGVTDGRPRATTTSAVWDGTSQMRHNTNGMIYNTDVTATGFYFFSNGGNNWSATVRVYGIK